MPGEEEVEGQVMRVRGRDGAEYEIPSDRVIGVRWTDVDGGSTRSRGTASRSRVSNRNPKSKGTQ